MNALVANELGDAPPWSKISITMVPQGAKDLYYSVARWTSLGSSAFARARYARSRGLRLHLGCGEDYRPGLINIDGNILRKKDVWLDLRNRLPFPSGSASLIYCSHMLEHLLPDQATKLMAEMCRVLSNDGVVRLAVPSFEHCLAIARGEVISTWPREFADPMSQAINYLLCDGQHKYAYCLHNLTELCEQAGFGDIYDYSGEFGVSPKEYGGITLGNEPEGSLVVELRRPVRGRSR